MTNGYMCKLIGIHEKILYDNAKALGNKNASIIKILHAYIQ